MTAKCPLTYLVNDVPRGVSPMGLNLFLSALTSGLSMSDFELGHYIGKNPEGSRSQDVASFLAFVERTAVTESQLDDELSVATITFKESPKWFKSRDSDPYGFPKKTRLGTIWKGVDMTAKDDDGRTAFIRAVIDGNLKLAETLAEYRETDINAKDNQGMTALHWACKNGLADLTAFCLSLPGLDTSVKSIAGLTAFDVAYREALWDDNDAIPTLFYKNLFEMDEYDPDNALLRLLTLTTDSRGKTTFPQEALFSPSRNGNVPLVQALLRNMSFTKPTVSNKYEETALHMAAGGGHTAIVVLLVGQAGFEINAVTKDGCTALHYAAREGYTQTVKELVGRGADVGIEDSCGNTALDLATKHEHHSTVQFLMERGAPMKTRDGGNGQAAETNSNTNVAALLHSNFLAHLAPASGHKEPNTSEQVSSQAGTQRLSLMDDQLSRTMGGQGASGVGGLQIPIQTSSQRTLHTNEQMSQAAGQKCNQKNDQIVQMEAALRVKELLRDYGSEINRRDNEGMTPLHVAIFSRDLDVVRMLIDQGANIEERFLTWRSPLEIAEEMNDKEIVALLAQSGARSSEQNARDREPELKVRKITVESKTEQAVFLQIESVAAVSIKPDFMDDDVIDMEIPLDQELASSPTSETSNATAMDDDGRDGTHSPEPHHVLESTNQQPLFTDISRSQTPEVPYNDHTEAMHEEQYEEHQEEYGWTSPARSISPGPDDNQYSGDYNDDDGYGGGGGDDGYGDW
ncbi:ankyrin repeat-containing domain protein [Morchella snyderi]|nr:ankyrin repeat-containing domain protein [Morchella snyderi]